MTGFLGAPTVVVAVIAGFVTSEPLGFLTVIAIGYVLYETCAENGIMVRSRRTNRGVRQAHRK